MSRLRAILRTAAFGAFSAGILAAYETKRVITPESRRALLLDHYRSRLSDGALGLLGAELRVRGQRLEDRGALIVANHQSALDIAVMLSVFQAVLVSRHDVAGWPLLGRLAKHGDTIFVDREDRRSGVVALREIRRQAMQGRTVVAFPEGGTFPGDSVHEFHPGAFAAVRSLDVPVIPAGLAYSPAIPYGEESFAQHIANVAARERTRIVIQIGESLPFGLEPRSAAELARARVEALVIEARQALGTATA
jgi:1-acyl-sn-glycerol-3-phosphate acyltransferase